MWLGVLIGGLLGFIFGFGSGWFVFHSHKEELEDLRNIKEEYDDYRKRVNDHFTATADAVDELTDSYQKVFTRLSKGAQSLMEKDELKRQMDKRKNKAVTLTYLAPTAESNASAPVSDKPSMMASEINGGSVNELTRAQLHARARQQSSEKETVNQNPQQSKETDETLSIASLQKTTRSEAPAATAQPSPRSNDKKREAAKAAELKRAREEQQARIREARMREQQTLAQIENDELERLEREKIHKRRAEDFARYTAAQQSSQLQGLRDKTAAAASTQATQAEVNKAKAAPAKTTMPHRAQAGVQTFSMSSAQEMIQEVNQAERSKVSEEELAAERARRRQYTALMRKQNKKDNPS